MRRVLATLVLVVGTGALVVLATGAGEQRDDRYWVELDNAFGLIKGGDLKIAGVRAGRITDLRLDKGTHRALVGFTIDRQGFGSLRSDARCDARPQSLIGEYFLDCAPGVARGRLTPGDRIPVERTSSTVSPDLINNIMRRPYRERFSIIIGELGAGVGGNGAELSEAIRRAHPALRETDRVLAKLGRQNRVLQQLVTDADAVVGDLAGNRRDVGRFVIEARDTARASATRRAELAAGFRRLPGFLAELRRTMPALGEVAREQGPALRHLSASADRVEELFDRLPPFAKASTPAFDALGEASKTGRGAMAKAAPIVDELNRFAPGVPELGKNLAITLEHLDDRDWAAEEDPRSPGGKGYTGLEALLTYVYDQTLSTNVFDSNVHYLKVAPFESECANYADAERVRETEGLEKHCGARIGPNAPGVFTRDPTARRGDRAALRHKTDRTRPRDQIAREDPRGEEPPREEPGTEGAPPVAPQAPAPSVPQVPSAPSLPGVPPIDVPRELPGLPGLGGPQRPAPGGLPTPENQKRLLDYLLAP